MGWTIVSLHDWKKTRDRDAFMFFKQKSFSTKNDWITCLLHSVWVLFPLLTLPKRAMPGLALIVYCSMVASRVMKLSSRVIKTWAFRKYNNGKLVIYPAVIMATKGTIFNSPLVSMIERNKRKQSRGPSCQRFAMRLYLNIPFCVLNTDWYCTVFQKQFTLNSYFWSPTQHLLIEHNVEGN